MIALTHNRRTQDLGHPRGNEDGSRYITSAVCGQWLLSPTASCAVYVWSESWACPGRKRSTVETTAWCPLLCKSESLATRHLPVPWRARMGDRLSLSSLSTVMGIVLFVICCCVSSYSPFSRDLGTVFLSSELPRLVYSCRHGSAVAPPSLSDCHCSECPNNSTMVVPFTMCNHGESQERNVSCVDSLSELLAAAV